MERLTHAGIGGTNMPRRSICPMSGGIIKKIEIRDLAPPVGVSLLLYVSPARRAHHPPPHRPGSGRAPAARDTSASDMNLRFVSATFTSSECTHTWMSHGPPSSGQSGSSPSDA